MKLRWLVTKNSVTRDDVQREFDKGDGTMKQCHAKLENRQGPTLQYTDDGENWLDVPLVTIINAKTGEW